MLKSAAAALIKPMTRQTWCSISAFIRNWNRFEHLMSINTWKLLRLNCARTHTHTHVAVNWFMFTSKKRCRRKQTAQLPFAQTFFFRGALDFRRLAIIFAQLRAHIPPAFGAETRQHTFPIGDDCNVVLCTNYISLDGIWNEVFYSLQMAANGEFLLMPNFRAWKLWDNLNAQALRELWYAPNRSIVGAEKANPLLLLCQLMS